MRLRSAIISLVFLAGHATQGLFLRREGVATNGTGSFDSSGGKCPCSIEALSAKVANKRALTSGVTLRNCQLVFLKRFWKSLTSSGSTQDS
jgi:hypothetical protein